MPPVDFSLFSFSVRSNTVKLPSPDLLVLKTVDLANFPKLRQELIGPSGLILGW